MNIDNEVIEFIKVQILYNPNVIESDVYEIAHVAEEHLPMYSLMVKWMETVDVVEKENIYEDMLYLKNEYITILDKKILLFPRKIKVSDSNNPIDAA